MIELTYIEGTGTQFINTGIAGNVFTRIILEILPSNNTLYENAFICSAWSEQGPLLISYRNKWRWHAGSVVDDGTIDTSNYSIIDMDLTGFYVNNTRYNFPGTGNRTSNPIMLFQRVGISGGPGAGKVKSLKIYGANDALLRDFIPARDDNNIVCLYDNISEEYFYNTGTGEFIGGEPVLSSYTVVYNANGGTGNMQNQNIAIDTPTPLTLNQFTREDYIFTGWSENSSGPVQYTDGEIVTNLADENESVTLYAIWQNAPFGIVLQNNKSELNKLDKDIETIETIYGTLRSECSIIDPIILLELDLLDFINCNYITIPKFGRSYFVRNVRSVRQGLIELSCHVDVLSSFKAEIRNNTGIIHRQENKWNLYMNDGSFRVYQNPMVLTKEFPSGFNTMEFILAVAGG